MIYNAMENVGVLNGDRVTVLPAPDVAFNKAVSVAACVVVNNTLIKCYGEPLKHNDADDLAQAGYNTIVGASRHLAAIQELVKLPLPSWRPRRGALRRARPEAPRYSHHLVPRA